MPKHITSTEEMTAGGPQNANTPAIKPSDISRTLFSDSEQAYFHQPDERSIQKPNTVNTVNDTPKEPVFSPEQSMRQTSPSQFEKPNGYTQPQVFTTNPEKLLPQAQSFAETAAKRRNTNHGIAAAVLGIVTIFNQFFHPEQSKLPELVTPPPAAITSLDDASIGIGPTGIRHDSEGNINPVDVKIQADIQQQNSPKPVNLHR